MLIFDSFGRLIRSDIDRSLLYSFQDLALQELKHSMAFSRALSPRLVDSRGNQISTARFKVGDTIQVRKPARFIPQ